jgi:hypothetical protein
MAGPVPAIHAFALGTMKTWMPATSAGMTGASLHRQKTPTATNEKARVHPASPHHRGRPVTEPLLTSLPPR